MKSMNIILTLLFELAVILSSCEKQQEDIRPSIDFQNDKKASGLIQADNLFAMDLFGEVFQLEEKENFMISPLSVSIALGMTYNGAENETKIAFEEALRLSGLTRHEINSIHGALISHLVNTDPKVSLEIANSIWVNQVFNLQNGFADTNRYYYDAEVTSLDFDDPNSANIINNWVSNKTHDKITEILNTIPPQTAMYLINALYYYGTWKFEFDKEDNRQLMFNYEDGTKSEVEAMEQKTDLGYYSDSDIQIAELPYGSDKFSMLILLPQSGLTTGEIMDKMNMESWNKWINSLNEREVQITLPKFTFEYETLLNEALKSMGLGVAFSGNADFSSMVEEPADLFISRVIHKTFVDVNEKGTEAAAVTAVEVGYTSVGPGDFVVSFIVDRPFFFAIREKTSNAIVFMGKVGRPEYDK